MQAILEGRSAGAAAAAASGSCSSRMRQGPCRGAQRQHAPPAAGPAARRRVVVAGSLSSDASSWGEHLRPQDTCHLGDQDRPGPLTDLDMEWQAFIAGKARYQRPQPLIWDQQDRSSSSSTRPASGGGGGGGAPSTSNRGPEASTSSTSSSSTSSSSTSGSSSSPDGGGSTTRYSSSIQSFDDWDEELALPVPCSAASSEVLQLGSAAAAAAAAAAGLVGSAASSTAIPAGMLPSCSSTGGSAGSAAPADVLGGRGLWQHLGEVYVLLFGVGQQDTEGIYSLRALSEEGLPTETIIAFENMEDAMRYAALLEATMEHSPAVCSIPPAELMAFCSDSGYRCRLELAGSLLMPPDYNVHVTDWERSLALREGRFHVLSEEPDVMAASSSSSSSARGMLGGPSSATAAALVGSEGTYSPWLQGPYGGEFSATQLDSLRAQLEALLPATQSVDDGEEQEGGEQQQQQ